MHTHTQTHTCIHTRIHAHSPILPVAVCIIVGFFIAEIFFAVYEMAISTIILSFCEDSTAHGTAKYVGSCYDPCIGFRV